MYDSFYDEDSTCPRCHAKITRGEWQTRRLKSLFEHWKKGDFLQYRKYETIPEQERKEKYRDWKLAPIWRVTEEFESDEPLLPAGKIPVYTSCDNCQAWLNAYAKIALGKFVGIVESEADGEEKELIRIKPETTAKTLREEFDKRLADLQESCKHEETGLMDVELTPHSYGKGIVCVRCEKLLETDDANIDPNDPIFRNIERSSEPSKKSRRSVDHDKILYRKP